MKQSGTLNSTDRFYFPDEVVVKPCQEGYLIIAVPTANWLVLPNDFQKELLQHLLKGETIGETYQLVTLQEQLDEFKRLLAAITARDFARTDETPKPEILDVTHQLTLFLTNACNLRCHHCFMHSGTPLDNELPVEEWKRILREFHAIGGKSVTFTGGEPLMNRDFNAILIYAHQQGLTTTVLSNGILWTKHMIESLSPYISEIQISIDGFDESSNAKIRGAGHFDCIVRNVILFANHGVRTSVATTFTFQNLQCDAAERYQQMVEHINSQCSKPVFFKLSKKILQGRNTHYTEAENREFYDRIIQIERKVNPEAQYRNFMDGHTPNLVTRNCGFGGLSIGSDGKIYYCNRLSEVESYGNIAGKALKPFIEQGRQIHHQTSVDHLQPCATCHLRYICCGGCRIEECNFQGRLQHHNGSLLQVKCSPETISKLERKMIDSYLYQYKF